MSEHVLLDEPRDTLPPLRIYHLLALTAILSGVLGVEIGVKRFWLSYLSDASMPQINSWGVVLVAIQCLALAACIAVIGFGLTWRNKGLPFPKQPGHWIAFYLFWGGLFRLTVSFLHLLYPPGFMIIQVTSLIIFHMVALALWIVAYRQERVDIWRWGWALIALRSVLSIAIYMIYPITMLFRFLYTIFWVSGEIDWRWPIQLQPSLVTWYGLIVDYGALVFVAVAVTADVRNSRQRHWSHWAVVVILCIDLLIFISYYHWAIINI